MRKVVLLVASFFVTVGGASSCLAATITIDFNSAVTAFNMPQSAPFYEEDDYRVTPSDGTAYIVNPFDPPFPPNPSPTMSGGNSSNFLTWSATSGTSITITRLNPGTFNLDQLLLGTLNSGTDAHYSITSGLTTLVPDTAVTGSISPGFTNLNSVTIHWLSGAALAIDNIVLTEFVPPAAVPEPASAVALCFGSLALVVRRLRRRNPVVA